MKKLLLSTLLATSLAFTQNAFAAKKDCVIKKFATVGETSVENLVNLEYDKFKITAGNEDDENNYYEVQFFAFRDAELNKLLPNELNPKEIKKSCSSEGGKFVDKYTPIFYSAKHNVLIIHNESYSHPEGAATDSLGTSVNVVNLANPKQEINFEESFKDKNFQNNPQLLQMIKNKILTDREIEDDGDVFPEDMVVSAYMYIEGFNANKIGRKNSLIFGYSQGAIFPRADGEVIISFTPEEINPFLKENSLLYKLLNDK